MFGFVAAESENIARLNQFDRGELVRRSDIAFLGKLKIKSIKKLVCMDIRRSDKHQLLMGKNAESPFKNSKSVSKSIPVLWCKELYNYFHSPLAGQVSVKLPEQEGCLW